MQDFAHSVVRWQGKHGRRGMPWQNLREPYRVWLSEVMLQQTQVEAVVGYYWRFVDRFPDVGALARASQHEVLRLWSAVNIAKTTAINFCRIYQRETIYPSFSLPRSYPHISEEPCVTV